MVAVILVNGQPVIHAGLREIFRDTEFEIVAEAYTPQEAHEALSAYPDALLVTEVTGDTWTSGAKRRKTRFSCFGLLGGGRKAVVLTVSENPTHEAEAYAAGAADYLPMSVSSVELLERLHKVQSGESRPRLPAGRAALPKKRVGVLTGRETQVVEQLSLGLSNKQISEVLGISIETVKEHVQHALRKLGLNDRTQAAVWYLRETGQSKSA